MASSAEPWWVAITRPLNRAYSHGGWMGAAWELTRSPAWMRAVAELTPATAQRLALAQAARSGSGAFMRVLENSPVLAAFGVAQELADAGHHTSGLDAAAGAAAAPTGAGSPPTRPPLRGTRHTPLSHAPVVVEWDVYLDLAVCRRVERALSSSAAGSRAGASAPDTVGDLPPHQLAALAADVVDSVVVSHGSLWHIALERLLGVSMHASIMQRSHGMTVHNWLRCYLRALAAAAPEVRLHGAPGAPPAPLLSVFLDVKSAGADGRVLDLLTRGLNDMGVHVWGVGSFVHAQLGALRGRAAPQVVSVPLPAVAADDGARAGERTPSHASPDKEEGGARAAMLGGGPGEAGIAPGEPVRTSRRWAWAEVAPGVAAEGGLPHAGAGDAPPPPFAQLTLPPPIAFHLFSFVGGIQRAVDAGALPRGAHVLFNGGTMLSWDAAARSGGALGASYVVHPALLADLDAYRRAHGLRLGFYTQEPLLDSAAADALVRAANDHPATFEHGFAYSGLPGHAPPDMAPVAGRPRPGWHVPWWLRWLVRPWRLPAAGGGGGC